MDYIVPVLLAVIIIQQVIAWRERRDLYDRIQSHSLDDYKAHEEDIENDYGEEDPDVVPLDEARDAIDGK